MDAALYMKSRDELELGMGTIVANPVPQEYSMDEAVINDAIDRALAAAAADGIKGKETTPYLLAKVKELTGGESLEANIALVINNARLASHIAADYAGLTD